MKRKDFLKKSVFSIGTFFTIPTLVSCNNDTNNSNDIENESGLCEITPSETKGPFPIKTPSDLVRENIISDRQGVPLLINLTIQNKDCETLNDVLVDVWHCDKDGNYSEYGGIQMQTTNYTDVHFLRGRQTTDTNGQASFISIYPGWYNGRAPHIHVEILNSNKTSLLITQIAFPEDISGSVYSSSLYASHGQANTSNSNDNVFSDSIDNEMGIVTGNLNDGFTISQTITVNN
ncbi:Dioxygenase [Flaviramulus basaltis]|uniref:Dioxygenase n=1 Tax=Flaviramulus basaltis TaxID=369401 RepID=A0A1K2INR5_9FLAO|nr:intradiol ring-cleavage dioxygenase [Flaviramulus basaltis]SFZ93898.1 Dioxygenase [Flaviramulus basaltis]